MLFSKYLLGRLLVIYGILLGPSTSSTWCVHGVDAEETWTDTQQSYWAIYMKGYLPKYNIIVTGAINSQMMKLIKTWILPLIDLNKQRFLLGFEWNGVFRQTERIFDWWNSRNFMKKFPQQVELYRTVSGYFFSKKREGILHLKLNTFTVEFVTFKYISKCNAKINERMEKSCLIGFQKLHGIIMYLRTINLTPIFVKVTYKLTLWNVGDWLLYWLYKYILITKQMKYAIGCITI